MGMGKQVGCRMCLRGLVPRDQGPDTHLSRGIRAKAPVNTDAVGDGRRSGKAAPGFLGLSRCSQGQGSNGCRC